MTEEHDHDHEHHGHDHEHDGHDHDPDHDHDHALIVDRLPEGHWTVDQHGSEVLFKARALFGLLPVAGIFQEFSGELAVDADGGVSGRLVVQTASVNSGIDRRDADLRSAAYFDSDTYPEMTFTVERLEPSGSEHLNMSGTLQIEQKSLPLRFPVYAIAHGDHLHLEGRVIVDHDAGGLGWSKPVLVGKRVRAEAALTLIRG
jgi:polyisoprenoid-binding protein YceI